MPFVDKKKVSGAPPPRRRRKKFSFEYLVFLVGIVFAFRWATGAFDSDSPPPVLYTLTSDPNVHVLGEFPHDKNAFTQGLLVESPGVLVESTGLYKRSSVRRVNATTGEALHHTTPFVATEFGEGITWNAATETYVALTWKARQAYVLHKDDFRILRKFEITATTRDEGWGITTIDETHELIMSDGSHVLHVWDPVTFEEKRRVSVVTAAGQPVTNLNELEYARGYVFANIWYSNLIAQIDPATGLVVRMHDLSSLSVKKNTDGDVLNGIAYDKTHDVFYVTGKLWDAVYKVQIVTKDDDDRHT
ncbi:Aste57867_13576 [Aphanomyces stellatus]|uniref:Aste57867_13576 protein n=1 Tax=Aphanomyces stellatus TaxID=120398 RepID=A0A485KZ78_9STRA|nr:hypothetical protein As57867_013526 [Aphanomyces stellatus]VFT90414.1 Aste57867_13576 [Aphanomyces stellatus]